MKNHKLPVLGIALMICIASCRKADVQHETVAATPAVAETKSAEWKALNNWSSIKSEKFSTSTSTIPDENITDAVVNNGLVLAFTKNGNRIKALPYQQTGENDAYWYYQVSKGSISFAVDVYNENANVAATQFKYFAISPDELKSLEAKGFSKIELMLLNYDDAAALLK